MVNFSGIRLMGQRSGSVNENARDCALTLILKNQNRRSMSNVSCRYIHSCERFKTIETDLIHINDIIIRYLITMKTNTYIFA